MSKQSKTPHRQRTITVPQNLQLLHQEVCDGIPVKVFAMHWKLVVRVFLFPDQRSIQLVIPTTSYLEMNLREIIDRAIDEAKKMLSEAKSLSPQPIAL